MARMAVNLNTGLVTGLGCHSATWGLGFRVLSFEFRLQGVWYRFLFFLVGHACTQHA